MEAVPVVMRFIRRQMRAHGEPGLSVPQLRVLTLLGRRPGVSLSAVAAHLGVTPPTASSIVDRLVRRGLVVRAVAPDERRRLTLTLTREGAAGLDRARDAARTRIAAVLQQLSDADLETVRRGLRLMRDAFMEVNADAPRDASLR